MMAALDFMCVCLSVHVGICYCLDTEVWINWASALLVGILVLLYEYARSIIGWNIVIMRIVSLPS